MIEKVRHCREVSEPCCREQWRAAIGGQSHVGRRARGEELKHDLGMPALSR